MQTRKALKLLSNGDKTYADRSNGLLEKNASKMLDMYEKREREILDKQRAASVPAPFLETIKNKVAKIVDAPNPSMPIVTKFDLYAGVRRVASRAPSDQGLKKLAAHLERAWHSEPLGTLAYKDVNTLVGFYKDQFPRSKAANVIEAECTKSGLHKLPVAKLARIASAIKSQNDYDVAMVANGLAGDRPEQVRARALVRELVGMRGDKKESGSKKAARNTLNAEQRITESIASRISASKTAQVEQQKFKPGTPEAVSQYRYNGYSKAYDAIQKVVPKIDSIITDLNGARQDSEMSGIKGMPGKIDNLVKGLEKWKGSLNSIGGEQKMDEAQVNSHSTGFMDRMKEKFNPFNKPNLHHQQDPNSDFDGSSINQRIHEMHKNRQNNTQQNTSGDGTSLRELEDASFQRGRGIDLGTPLLSGQDDGSTPKALQQKRDDFNEEVRDSVKFKGPITDRNSAELFVAGELRNMGGAVNNAGGIDGLLSILGKIQESSGNNKQVANVISDYSAIIAEAKQVGNIDSKKLSMLPAEGSLRGFVEKFVNEENNGKQEVKAPAPSPQLKNQFSRRKEVAPQATDETTGTKGDKVDVHTYERKDEKPVATPPGVVTPEVGTKDVLPGAEDPSLIENYETPGGATGFRTKQDSGDAPAIAAQPPADVEEEESPVYPVDPLADATQTDSSTSVSQSSQVSKFKPKDFLSTPSGPVGQNPAHRPPTREEDNPFGTDARQPGKVEPINLVRDRTETVDGVDRSDDYLIDIASDIDRANTPEELNGIIAQLSAFAEHDQEADEVLSLAKDKLKSIGGTSEQNPRPVGNSEDIGVQDFINDVDTQDQSARPDVEDEMPIIEDDLPVEVDSQTPANLDGTSKTPSNMPAPPPDDDDIFVSKKMPLMTRDDMPPIQKATLFELNKQIGDIANKIVPGLGEKTYDAIRDELHYVHNQLNGQSRMFPIQAHDAIIRQIDEAYQKLRNVRKQVSAGPRAVEVDTGVEFDEKRKPLAERKELQTRLDELSRMYDRYQSGTSANSPSEEEMDELLGSITDLQDSIKKIDMQRARGVPAGRQPAIYAPPKRDEAKKNDGFLKALKEKSKLLMGGN